MKYRLIPEAEAELDEAAAWLNEQKRGLGRELIEEYRRAVIDILAYPRANPVVGLPHIRRKRLGRFTYGIVYQVHGDEVIIYAFTHLHRRPGYWRDRVK